MKKKEQKRLKNQTQELQELLEKANQQISFLKSENEKQRQKISSLENQTPQIDQSSKIILGWNIVKAADGYHRAFKKYGGKMYAVYIGKSLIGAKKRSNKKLGRWKKKFELDFFPPAPMGF